MELLPLCIGALTWQIIVCTVCSSAASLTISNSCSYTIWPGILPNAGSYLLSNGGFELGSGQSASVHAPTGWSGRIWGRTYCKFSASGIGNCASGDCGGKLQCQGAGAATPATLAEITLAGLQATVKQDFYDVSLVDGYNIPVAIVPSSGTGTCGLAGCARDLNLNCPTELQVMSEEDGVVGCKSACDAFGDAEYCCAGQYANPNTCKPSTYSQLFKAACPRAYSYAFDDPTSTFTCTNADYTIVFCPSTSSQKAELEQAGSSLVGAQQAYANSSSSSSPGGFRVRRNVNGPTTTLLVTAIASYSVLYNPVWVSGAHS